MACWGLRLVKLLQDSINSYFALEIPLNKLKKYPLQNQIYCNCYIFSQIFLNYLKLLLQQLCFVESTQHFSCICIELVSCSVETSDLDKLDGPNQIIYVLSIKAQHYNLHSLILNGFFVIISFSIKLTFAPFAPCFPLAPTIPTSPYKNNIIFPLNKIYCTTALWHLFSISPRTKNTTTKLTTEMTHLSYYSTYRFPSVSFSSFLSWNSLLTLFMRQCCTHLQTSYLLKYCGKK